MPDINKPKVTDYLDFSKYTYSSVNDLFMKILDINERSLNILQGLTKALVSTSDESVEIKLKNKDGELVSYFIPSLSYLADKTIDLKDQLDKLKNVESLKYAEIDFSTLNIYSRPSNLIQSPTLNNSTLSINDNDIIKNLYDKTFNIDINIMETNPLSKQIDVFQITVDKKHSDKITNFRTQIDLIYKSNLQLQNWLSENKIPFETSNITYNMNLIETHNTGEYIVIDVTNEGIELNSIDNSVQTILLNNSVVRGREGRHLVVGDELVKNTNIVYKIIEVEPDNKFKVQSVSELNRLKAADKLHFLSTILPNRKINISINPNVTTFLYFRNVSPNLSIVGDIWSPGVIVDPDLIMLNEDSNKVSIREYVNKNCYDYSEFFDSIKQEMLIPFKAGIKPNTPILNSDNFKVVRINGHISTDNSEELNSLLKDFDFYTNRIQQLHRAKLEQENLLKTYLETHVPDTISQGYEEQISDILNSIIKEETFLSEIKNKLKNLQYKIPDGINDVSAKYAVLGIWEFPQPLTDLKGRKQDVIQFEVEYSYLNLGKQPSCVPSIDFKLFSNEMIKTMFNKCNIVKTETRQRVFNNDTGKWLFEFDYSDNTTTKTNTCQIPINAYEIVMIRVRGISEAGYPNNLLYSDWSDPIYINFPEEFKNIQNIEESKKQIINSTIDNNANDIKINNLMQKIKELENTISKINTYNIIELHELRHWDNTYANHPHIIKPNTILESVNIVDYTLGRILCPGPDYTLNVAPNNEVQILWSQNYINQKNQGDLYVINYKVKI